jgi:hypothetical protein
MLLGYNTNGLAHHDLFEAIGYRGGLHVELSRRNHKGSQAEQRAF